MPRAGLTIEGGGDAKGTLLTPVQKAQDSGGNQQPVNNFWNANANDNFKAPQGTAINLPGTPGGAAPTANGNPVLGSDGYYYQPMSDGSWVKGIQGQNTQDTSAITDIQNVMNGVGLSGLAAKAYQDWKNGVPVSEIMSGIQGSPEYAQRFPGMAALAKTGNRISEASYIDKENADRSLLQNYGISPGTFGSTNDLGTLISNNVSTAELQSRLVAAHDSIMNEDPAIIQYLKDNFNMTNGDLAGYFLDPKRGLQDIQTRANAGQLGGIAAETGVGINAGQATRLAQYGINPGQSRGVFNQIGMDSQLMQNLPGSNPGDSVSQDQELDARFTGDAASQKALDAVRARRLAEFQNGGGFASSQQGVSGLGVANTL
jgi:hypothetical protein